MNPNDSLPDRDSNQGSDSSSATDENEFEEQLGKLLAAGQYAGAVQQLRHRIAKDPHNVRLHIDLGALLIELNRNEEAIASYMAAHRLRQDCDEICNRLGTTFAGRGLYEPAIYWFERARQIEPTGTAYLSTYGRVLLAMGRREEAVHVFENWTAMEPNNPIVRHLATAILGRSAPDKAPVEYIKRLFDDYASTFDHSLAKLNYCGPRIVLDELDQLPERPATGWDILDVGCGTGLVGAAVRSMARRLTGIDLSARMLAIAKDRSVYDELIEADLIRFLRDQPGQFDVLTAADVLPYLGDLSDFFRLSFQALRPRGLAIVMVEEMAVEGSWRMNSSGRYCHSRKHLLTALESAGFVVRSIRGDVMRYESQRPVATLVAVGCIGGK